MRAFSGTSRPSLGGKSVPWALEPWTPRNSDRKQQEQYGTAVGFLVSCTSDFLDVDVRSLDVAKQQPLIKESSLN